MRDAITMIRTVVSLICICFAFVTNAPALAQAPVALWSVTPTGTNGEGVSIGGWDIWKAGPATEVEYPRGRVLFVDTAGNSYVAGIVGSTAPSNNTDFIAIKYDAGGNEVWRAISNGDLDDRVSGIAVDNEGSVILLGTQSSELNPTTIIERSSSIALIKFDSSGNLVWRVNSSLADYSLGLALDGAGNAIVTGAKRIGGHTTFKYSGTTGDLLWQQLNSTGATDQQKMLVVDGAGNSYVSLNVAGYGNYNYVTVKYNGDGVQQWRKSLSPASSLDFHRAFALALDSNGAVYLTGGSFGLEWSDLLLVKYDTNGNEQWRRPISSSYRNYKLGRAIAIDNVGNVMVTGYAMDSTNAEQNFMTVKFDSTGYILWQTITDYTPRGHEFSPSIASDSNQNAYVTGYTQPFNGPPQGVVLKLNGPTGAEQWRTLFGANANIGQSGALVSIDAAQRVVVAGSSSTGNLVIVKYSQSGPTVPNPPTIISTSLGTANVQINFKPALSNGGSPILQFIARCGTTNAAIGPASPLTVPDLLPGVAYSCTVEAANALGNSAKSTPVPVLWVVAPSAPMNLTATAGDSQAHITFTPPQSNGGGAIAGYTATCNPGAIGATGLFSPVTVGGLVNDQTYSCNVRAINSGGESPSSETVSVTPSTSAPMILVGAESKRTHGTAGAFGIPLLITDQASDPFTVEPRMFAEGHEIIFRFSRAVSMPGMVSAQDGNGDAVQATIAGYSGNAVRVSLVGVPNKARLSISLGGVNGSISTAVLMGFLAGDINGSHSVTAADISAVKANNGKPVSSTSFRFDLDGSGVINGADLSFAKARAGTKLD